MDAITITIPVDVQRFSQNVSHRDWRGRASAAKKARRLARTYWLKAGAPKADRACIVHITVHRARHIDYFNIHGACKGLIDGLFNDAITPDDSPKWIRPGAIEQDIRRCHKDREYITFTIEPFDTEQETKLWDKTPSSNGRT